MIKFNIFFIDNKFVPADEQLIRRLTPGILKARGVFETLRVYPTGKIFGLQEHLSRLKRGLKILKIESPLSEKQMKEALQRLLELNHLTSARVRIMLWQGQRRVHAAIMAVPYHPFSKRKYIKGFKAMISKTKLDKFSLMKDVKSLNYVSFLKAYERAKAQGYDEVLLLNHRGELVEASRSNVFFLKDGTLCTPALASGCLEGITRGLVLKIAQRMKMKTKQMTVVPQYLLNAQEVFLTNSLIELMPLTSIDGKLVADGKAGPVTLKILREYRRLAAMRSIEPSLVFPPAQKAGVFVSKKS
ncbi:MAG TPA: aminotransferase class IV [Candidatus Omnitrophota bacterium]|nr:aminotransferase class IV [Candidatus Omnitrophota bacterium]